MPDGFGGFIGDPPDQTAATLGEFARNGWLNIVGGCCGTTPDWIAAITAGEFRATISPAARSTPDGPD